MIQSFLYLIHRLAAFIRAISRWLPKPDKWWIAFLIVLSLDAIAVVFLANTCVTASGPHCSTNWESDWAAGIGLLGAIYLALAALPLTILFFLIAIVKKRDDTGRP